MPSNKKNRIVLVKNEDGSFQPEGLGNWRFYWRDPYHLLLMIRWRGFFVIVALLYFSINAFFAILFVLGGDGIANAEPGSFKDAYFFSVQTFASIGYGAMYPKSFYANFIVCLEAIVSLVSIALLTGIAFARFSRSTARIMFSKVAVIHKHNGLPTLVFRAANERSNDILEAQVRVHLLQDEVTLEGESIRRIYDLKLNRDRSYSFRLSWTIFHPIDPNSPLYERNLQDLLDAHATIIVTITGYDETVSQPVHSRHTYGTQSILWNYRFIDTIHLLPNGDRAIDYSKFHEIRAIE
jgi:inward rectifier potassium channel